MIAFGQILREANLTIRNDKVSVRKLTTVALKESLHDFNLVRSSFILQTEQHNTPMRVLRTKYFFAEIFICGYQNSILDESLLNNIVISHATRFVKDRNNIKTLYARPTCQAGACAFIYKKTHLGRFRHQRHERCFLQRFHCKVRACLNVLLS